MKQRTPLVTAKALCTIFFMQFGHRMISAYRLEWHELRILSRQTQLTEKYIEEINEVLKTWNLTLTSYLDFLVVDKLDHTKGLRRLHSGLLRLSERDCLESEFSSFFLRWIQRFI